MPCWWCSRWGAAGVFPNLLPDRLDFTPWRNFGTDRDGLFRAAMNSAGISVTVSSLSTCGVAFQPFVTTPWPAILVFCCVIFALRALTCHRRSRRTGSFHPLGIGEHLSRSDHSPIHFCLRLRYCFFLRDVGSGRWSAEQLVAMLGRPDLARLPPRMLPRLSGLIAVCWLQTALFSWLDYGLVSVIGGG